MQIFISADSSKNLFIQTIEALIDDEYQGRHNHVFIPWNPSNPQDSSLMARIKLQMIKSNLFLMDATPEQLTNTNGQTVWMTNQGVLIEYGILAGFNLLNQLCIFCEDQVSRTNIHPAIHKPVDNYSQNDLASFQDDLRSIISSREKMLEEEVIKTRISQLSGSGSTY